MTTNPLTNPFPGLRPFEAQETHLFFGRDGQASAIVQKLAARHFVAVVGTSGSGKSSLVRAGLLPALEGGFMTSAGSFWRIALMRPGGSPIRNLARALAEPAVFGGTDVDSELRTPLIEAVLRRSGMGLIDALKQARLAPNENVLLVVDQFEELFRFRDVGPTGRAADDCAAFVALLVEAAKSGDRSIYIALTMRSDFLGDCARFRDLPELLNDAQYLVPRLTRDQRRAVIEGPIAVSGATIAPRLTQRLLNDAGEDPDVLPVLQHALMRTWDAWHEEGRPDAPIDLDHYLGIGGMTEALSQHADQAYAELAQSPGAQAVAQCLFRCLCERSSDFRETRRPTPVAELCAVAGTDMATMTFVIDAFRSHGRTFLLPGWPIPLDAATVVDISHESLIRQWGTLRGWVEREARTGTLYQRLRQTAQLWPDSAALWRNPDLERALRWEREESPTAAWAARYGTREEFERAMRFLRDSENAQRKEMEQEAAAAREASERQIQERTQQEREARLRSQKRLLSAVAVLVPLLIVGLGWALIERSKAEGQRTLAESRAREAAEQMKVAEEAREQSEKLLQRLTNSNRLKQAFLKGDVAAIERLALDAPRDTALRFRSTRTGLGWKAGDGKSIYQWDLYPSEESLRVSPKPPSQISYYMNHPTFIVKLLSAGAGTGFRVSYNGWGCLAVVYVLVEYADEDTPPTLTTFDGCSAVWE